MQYNNGTFGLNTNTHTKTPHLIPIPLKLSSAYTKTFHLLQPTAMRTPSRSVTACVLRGSETSAMSVPFFTLFYMKSLRLPLSRIHTKIINNNNADCIISFDLSAPFQ